MIRLSRVKRGSENWQKVVATELGIVLPFETIASRGLFLRVFDVADIRKEQARFRAPDRVVDYRNEPRDLKIRRNGTIGNYRFELIMAIGEELA